MHNTMRSALLLSESCLIKVSSPHAKSPLSALFTGKDALSQLDLSER